MLQYIMQELFHGATIFEKGHRLIQGEKFLHITMGYAIKRVNNSTEIKNFSLECIATKKRAASCLY